MELHSVLGRSQLPLQERRSVCNDANGILESAWKDWSHRDCFCNGYASTGFANGIAEKNLQSTHSFTDNGSGQENPLVDDRNIKNQEQDLLSLLSMEDALHLCELFAEEANIMYPFLDMDNMKSQVRMIFTPTESELKHHGLSATERDIIILMLAVALMIKGGGESNIGKSLFVSTKVRLENKIWSPMTLTDIKVLVLAVRMSGFDGYTY
ncbi:hypothetical protein EIK77_006544 [Talaromyces pinophilus]|nr:hypothetical protein EIK77_006544 [Talaromyces pinophilus]